MKLRGFKTYRSVSLIEATTSLSKSQVARMSDESLWQYIRWHKDKRDLVYRLCWAEWQLRQKRRQPKAPMFEVQGKEIDRNRLPLKFDPVVDKLLDDLPKSVWKSDTTTFLDPAMGSGQFLRRIVDRLRKAGHSDENIEKRVFGFEAPEAIARAVQSHSYMNADENETELVGNFYYADYDDVTDRNLKELQKMKFDVIVGNPPYKIESNPNYYIKFLDMVKESLADEGHVAFIIPNRFLSPNSKAGKQLQSWLAADTVYPNLDEHFDVATSIGGFVGRKSSKKKKTIMKFPEGEIERDLSSPTPIVGTSVVSSKIIDKVVNSPFERMEIDNHSDSKNFVFIETSYTRYRSTTPSGGEKTLVAHVNKTNGTGSIIPFDSKKQAKVNEWFLTKSKLGRFMIYSFAMAMFANSSPVHHGFMPMLPEDTEMSDENIYKLFKLDKKMIDHLEKVML